MPDVLYRFEICLLLICYFTFKFAQYGLYLFNIEMVKKIDKNYFISKFIGHQIVWLSTIYIIIFLYDPRYTSVVYLYFFKALLYGLIGWLTVRDEILEYLIIKMHIFKSKYRGIRSNI